MGFDSFEFGPGGPVARRPGKLKDKASTSGLKLVICGAFGPDRDLTHDDASVRDNSLNYITEAIEICQKSGTRVLAGPMYSAVGKRRHVAADQKKKEWDLAVKGLKEAGGGRRTTACCWPSSRSIASRPTWSTPPSRPSGCSMRSATARSGSTSTRST
jgi:hypothetical protein